MKSFHRLAEAYKGTALITFNTLVLFVALNVILFLGDKIWRSVTTRPTLQVVRKYGVDLLKTAYPDLSKEQMLQLLNETWTRPLVHEPFTEFKDGPFSGRFVNVDSNGFRRIKSQSPWPPSPDNFNVFVFGGSTTFGYGVPDEQTVPSFLQEKLPATVGGRRVCVFNFGRAHYYSTQERILFEQLLTAGRKPDFAIFIDGLNEFFYANDQHKFAKQLTDCLSGELLRQNRLGMFAELPLMQKLSKAARYLSKKSAPAADDNDSEAFSQSIAEHVCERYRNNQRLIQVTAAQFHVPVCFVWQPVPTYKYNLANHPFMKGGFGEHQRSALGYLTMAAQIATNSVDGNFLWCADMQENLKEPLYVDVVHYSGKMGELFAGEIVRQIGDRNLLKTGK